MASPTLGKDLSSKLDKNTGPLPESRFPRHSGVLQNDLVDQLYDPVFSLDLQGNIVGCNHAALQTYGYSATEMIGRNIVLLYSDENQVSPGRVLRNILEKGQHSCQLRTREKSGNYIYVHLSFSLLRDTDALPVGIALVLTEIPEQNSLELALSETQQRRKLS